MPRNFQTIDKIQRVLANHSAIAAEYERRGHDKAEAQKLASSRRIEMDRLWRSAKARKEFEAEYGFAGEQKTVEYEDAFMQWAVRRVMA